MTELSYATIPSKDPRLDWSPVYDPRSRAYPIRGVVGSAVVDRPKMWTPGVTLDQGQEGACVGFGWTGELVGSPRPYSVNQTQGNAYAKGIYHEAQTIDEWPGEDYEGTSVLAGAKVVQARGFMESYHWAFSIEDVRDAIITTGPVVIGIPWYEGMYETRTSGLVSVDGEVVGGHCIKVDGYHPSMRLQGEPYSQRFKVFRWQNSWGDVYGKRGAGYIRYEDLRDLLSAGGEACVPTNRRLVRF